MDETPSLAVEELLAHTAWLRTLARTLVRDEHAAEDLVQEAWRITLAGKARPVELRAWLSGVVRRLALRRHRERHARARREARSAWRGDGPGAAPAERWLEEAELQQRLLAAVLALAEPARSTVVARYFEGASAAEIARRAGVPESTVRTRLQRALAELRRALDRELGGRSAWSALAAGSGGAGAVLAGSPVPAWPAVLACLALAGVAVGVARFGGRDPERANGAGPKVAAVSARVASGGADAPPRETGGTPGRLPVPESARDPMELADGAEPGAPLDWRIAGRVLDPEGRPLAGASVLLCAKGPRFRESDALVTGAEGDFEVEFASEREARDARVVGVMHPRHLAAYAPLPRGPKAFANGMLRLDVKLRPAYRAAFLVTDEAGVPISGAWIAVADANANGGRDIPDDPDAEPRPAWGALFSGGRRLDAKTDDAGLASFENAPEGELAVTVSRPGYVPAELARVRADRPPFECRHVVLARGKRLAGRVLDPAGNGVAGAEVRLLAASLVARDSSAADGSFEIAGIPTDAQRAEVLVTHPAFAPWYRSARQGSAIVLDGTPLEVQLATGRTLELFLVDATTGRPFDGPLTVVLGSRAGVLVAPQVDAQHLHVSGGSLSLERVPEFADELYVHSDEHEPVRLPVEALSGEPVRLVARDP